MIGKEDIEEEFLKLIKEYPNVKKVLPILLAIRENKLKNPLYETFVNSDYTFNLELLYSGVLEEVILSMSIR